MFINNSINVNWRSAAGLPLNFMAADEFRCFISILLVFRFD